MFFSSLTRSKEKKHLGLRIKMKLNRGMGRAEEGTPAGPSPRTCCTDRKFHAVPANMKGGKCHLGNPEKETLTRGFFAMGLGCFGKS